MSSPALPPSAGSAGTIGHMRLFGRLATGFALDLTAIVRGKRELLDALLLAAIANANAAAILTDPELQATLAATDMPPPDELRQPVSVEAAAAELKIPVEEARWRIRRLMRRKLCVAAEGGVIVPSRYLATPEYLKSTFEGYERLREFYYVVRDLGMLHNLPPPSVELSAELAPLRVVARLATNYLLRVLESLTAPLGDPISGMVLLTVFHCNIEHLPIEERGGGALTVEDMVPDRPAPVGRAPLRRRPGRGRLLRGGARRPDRPRRGPGAPRLRGLRRGEPDQPAADVRRPRPARRPARLGRPQPEREPGRDRLSFSPK
jgi:hypothetical protein